jgi:DNA-binding beta-propeller fold protein YncE
MRKKTFGLEIHAAALVLTCGLGLAVHAQDKPVYKVDPFWPKELPHNWMIGHIEQIIPDQNDHIWVLTFTGSMEADDMGLAQKPPFAECCIPSPEVLEFDREGNVLKGWGGKGYIPDWPEAVHAFYVDKKGNVWIGGNHAPDRQLLKFSSDGKLLLEIGRPTRMKGRAANVPPNNQSTTMLGAPSSIWVDEDANEVYVGDGYVNKRVVVFDSNTGAFKRGWGAYGISVDKIPNSQQAVYDPGDPYVPTAPPLKNWRGPVVGLTASNDGLLYVCDRTSDRIQIFTKQGKFVKEFFVAKETTGEGSTMALAFSQDPQQKYLFVGDGANNVVWILDRQTGAVVDSFGHRGHNAGQFDYLDTIAVDSKGDLYTGEVKYNNRLQKFILQK